MGSFLLRILALLVMLARLLVRGSQAFCAALCRTIVARYGLDTNSTISIELCHGTFLQVLSP